MIASPSFLVRLGIALMIVGITLPFLMIIRVVESTFFLNFLSWGASVAGLSCSSIGYLAEWEHWKE